MTDHPMLFSPPMILALLREAKEPGTGKTQTRRVVRGEVPPQPAASCHPRHQPKHPAPYLDAYCSELKTAANPRGMSDEWCWWQVDDRQCLPTFKVGIKPGDRVWCRETWRLPAVEDDRSPLEFLDGVRQIGCSGPNGLVRFEADGRDAWLDHYGSLPLGRLRQGRHLPRELSRLTLYVSEVRVQRLQDICEADARAEGAYVGKASGRVADNYATMAVAGHWFASARGWYADLWERLNGPGSWQANPFVAAYTFVPRLGNIDTLPAALMEDA